MKRRRLAALAFAALLLVVAGCTAPIEGDLGRENGYRFDDPVDVTVDDGLNATEREAVVSRAMARIERIREIEFTNTTEVEVISRAEYRNRSGGSTDPANLSDEQLWNEQVWEALHIVGEDTTYPETRSTNRGTSVLGYYSPSRNHIVIVSDSATPTIDRGTLVHELVHALQDQQLSLGEWPEFQDAQLAENGVVEGEANYIEATYEQRCGSQWSCIPVPETQAPSRPPQFNSALLLVSLTPYVEGPDFIDTVRSSGGWDAVDDLYEEFPESTEQIIHPERYPGDAPVNVTLPDRSSAAWSRFDVDRPVYDVVGEASIYAMFVGTGVIDRNGAERYNYDHPISAGWEGDKLVPYRNGDEYGYVWRTQWASPDEARDFAEAYRDLLDTRDARVLGDGRFRIPDGAYADAFRLTRSGSTVTIVNAPRPAALDGVHGR